MNAPDPCEPIKAFLLEHLERDIAAHERGDFSLIGQGKAQRPFRENCTGGDDEEEERLVIAWDFWDRWTDARNHDWGYYPGVERDDWPLIARQIGEGLRAGWSSDRMRENAVFSPAPRSPHTGFWRRWRARSSSRS